MTNDLPITVYAEYISQEEPPVFVEKPLFIKTDGKGNLSYTDARPVLREGESVTRLSKYYRVQTTLQAVTLRPTEGYRAQWETYTDNATELKAGTILGKYEAFKNKTLREWQNEKEATHYVKIDNTHGVYVNPKWITPFRGYNKRDIEYQRVLRVRKAKDDTYKTLLKPQLQALVKSIGMDIYGHNMKDQAIKFQSQAAFNTFVANALKNALNEGFTKLGFDFAINPKPTNYDEWTNYIYIRDIIPKEFLSTDE